MAGLHTLKRMALLPKRRVGRGGKRGKTAGRGTKGQNARSGRKKRPELRDIIKKLPKRRGYGKNRGRTVIGDRSRFIPVSLERLDRMFESASDVTLQSLSERLSLRTHGRAPLLKIVGGGAISKKLSIKGIAVSGSARAAIEKAGGTIS